MNYKDFLPIQEDIVSLGRSFGKDSQVTVIGWSGYSGRTRKLVVHCSTCAKDPELFGEGVFGTFSGNLSAGAYPCGCSSSSLWTEDQQKVRAKRKAKSLGFTFIDWFGVYKRSHTRTIMLCCKHGLWKSTKLQALITQGHGCPGCSAEKSSIRESKSDHYRAEVLSSTNLFALGTVFEKAPTLTNWRITCGSCKEVYVRSYINLRYKGPACKCSGKDISYQRYAYVHLISDNEIPIALKFGITGDVKNRLKQQAYRSKFQIENLFAYEFDNPNDCRQAETICKSELTTKVLNVSELPDGYTETTYISNLDFIIKTYESLGGRRSQICA